MWMAFLTALGVELPWPIIQVPLIPRSGAPPYSEASTRFRISFSAGRIKTAARRRHGVLVRPAFSDWPYISASPSHILRAMFPQQPSHTTTSATPRKKCFPSTFPMKLRWLCFSMRKASLVTSLPLVSSSPIANSPTAGDSLPFLTAYQLYRYTNRGKPLFAERHPRRFFHMNHFCGMANGDRQVVRL